MQCLQSRIDSFHKTRRVKRYPKSSSTVPVKWPHPDDFKANPNTLAEAGFFFSPSWNDRDSVACFLCGKELSDWDEDDDPFEIHYTKCKGSCAWALLRCGLAEGLDNLASKAMEGARLKTFGKDWWPHDAEPDHGASSINMAQAGFVYTPQAVGDDTVTCLHCNLALSGWEDQDDPIQEHRSRDSKSDDSCPFLALSSKKSRSKPVQPAADPPPARAKRGRARTTTSTAPAKSRRKTKATHGKSAKASAPISQRSPSPSQTVSRDQDEAAMDIDVPEPHITQPDSTHSLPDEPVSPPGPATPTKPDTPLDTALNHPDPIISLSPAGQPTIATSEILTQQERSMSVEQWIRQEIALSHERLLTDGRIQIDLFKSKAADLRKCIDEL